MKGKNEKLEIVKVILGAAFAVVMLGISFGLGWYAKELSVIKQNQLKSQDVIQDMQNDVREITGKIGVIEQNYLKLRGQVKDVQTNIEKSVSNMAKAIEQNQLELQDSIENIQKNIQEMTRKIALIKQNQIEFQALIERISEEVLPKASLEVISTDPPSPAVLNLGEKLNVKFRYQLSSSGAVQIWARPYTRGSRTPGYKAHGSSHYKKAVRESGVAEGWFYFDEPTVVDDIRVNMWDVTTGENVHTISYKIDARWIRSKVDKKEQARSRKTEDKRILIDINNPEGEGGWRDEYVIKLKSTGDIRKEFGVNWYRPHSVASLSTEKPALINTLPKFRHDMQRYLILRLGDADDNQIVGVMDFRKPDRIHFPFDLYLDIDRDGDLAEDFIESRRHIKGICVPYKDGTTENYALHLYSTHYEPIGVNYQSFAGRYGILEADKKRIQILIIDNSGNGIFNDDDDIILLDWDLDGKLDGSHQADDDRPLYSLLELPGASYRVAEFDAPGHRMVLRRQGAK